MKRLVLYVLLAGVVLGVIVPIVLVFAYTRDLPALDSLSDYHPNEVTRVYSDDGQLIAQLYNERRTVVGKDRIPAHVLHAFIAAEDGNFYEHKGLDYLGLARAIVRGIARGGHFKGTSTITQQLVKTMVTGPERSLRRKIREAVLTKRLEDMLSKDDILNIYLNQIVFGRGNYGIEEAARAYFGKSVSEVDVAEAAILGGIPKNPERYNPKGDLAAVKERQKYVLTQMVEKGYIDQATADAAFNKPIASPKEPYPYLGKAPHFAEIVRRQLEAKYGGERLYSGGLTIYTTVDAKLQSAAHQAVRSGLRAIDRRQGFRGPKLRVEADAYARVMQQVTQAFSERRDALLRYRGIKDAADAPMVWDLVGFTGDDLRQQERMKDKLAIRQLTEGDELVGIVDTVDNAKLSITVHLGGTKVVIGKDGYAWARKFNPTEKTPPPRLPSEVVRQGDLVAVRIDSVTLQRTLGAQLKVSGTLSQDPKVEGSLVAIDPNTHFVRAIVGGDALESTGLIRPVQSKRQPGSSFKAILYAAAINSKQVTNGFVCSDTPVVFRDPTTGEAWKPQNFESDVYEGDLILRRALAKSKNTCSVKLIEKIGVDETIAMAKALGIETELPRNMTIALGSGDVTLLELVNAYTTLASQGRYAAPIYVRKVVDRSNVSLEENQPELGEERVDPAVAYVATQLLTAPIIEPGGTAGKAQSLERPLAGKTGTSSEHRNALFVGYSPDIVMGVWTGFDDNTMMGPETGGSAALPIWIGTMRQAIINLPNRDFTMPEEGVAMVNVDLASGYVAEVGAPGSMLLPFLTGTEPQEAASQAVRKDFYEQDQ
ncbi:MAG: PBP1A family penicillin-binding protein [Deltaproteobacteria bacterium]|nr:PBP1A family penicillin-binding protein [Deltaproteobacteria bacterium]